jgi:hypothetical protein
MTVSDAAVAREIAEQPLRRADLPTIGDLVGFALHLRAVA